MSTHFYRPITIFLSPRRILHLTTSPEQLSKDSSLIYRSANRLQFYRTLGIFTVLQGGFCSIFLVYCMGVENPTLKQLKSDIDQSTYRAFERIEKITHFPIIRSIRDYMGQVVDIFADGKHSLKSLLGLSTSTQAAEPSSGIVSKVFAFLNIPVTIKQPGDLEHVGNQNLLLKIMPMGLGLFAFFLGCVLPRRVVREIRFLPRRASSTEQQICITTYGCFGYLPQQRHLIRPLSHMQSLPSTEAANFIYLRIKGNQFLYYLEKRDAEHFVPEYFDSFSCSAKPQQT